MLIPVSTKLDFKNKQKVDELLRAFANSILTQKELEDKLRKMRIKEIFKYL